MPASPVFIPAGARVGADSDVPVVAAPGQLVLFLGGPVHLRPGHCLDTWGPGPAPVLVVVVVVVGQSCRSFLLSLLVVVVVGVGLHPGLPLQRLQALGVSVKPLTQAPDSF